MSVSSVSSKSDEDSMLEMVSLRKELDLADAQLEASKESCTCAKERHTRCQAEMLECAEAGKDVKSKADALCMASRALESAEHEVQKLASSRDDIKEKFDLKEQEVLSVDRPWYWNWEGRLMSLLRTGAYEASDWIREYLLDGLDGDQTETALYCFMKHGNPELLDGFLDEHLSCEMNCHDRWCFMLGGQELCTSAFTDVGAVRGATSADIARVVYSQVKGHVDWKDESECTLATLPYEVASAFLKQAIKLQDVVLFQWAIEVLASCRVARDADRPLGWGIRTGTSL